MSSSILESARGYLARGFSVIPLKNKKPTIKSWKQFQERHPTEEELLQWFENGTSNNIGIVTGKLSGVVVIGLESPEAARFAMDHGFPPTAAVKAGEGFQVYFRYQNGIRNFQKRDDLPGIDLHGEGDYVLAPPSVDESGQVCHWMPNRSLDDIPLAPLPESILVKDPTEKTSSTTEAKAKDEDWENEKAFLALTEESLNDLRRSLRGTSDEYETVAIKKSIREHEEIIAEMRRKIPTQGGKSIETSGEISISVGIHLTDLGNAQRFASTHGKDVRFCYPWNDWVIWDGQRWKVDTTGEATRRAKETVKLIYNEGIEAQGEDQRKKLCAHALKTEADSKIKAMLSLARSEPGIHILPDELDKDPWLLNVVNGTIDLKAGILREHRREDLITKLAPIEYRPEATCPLWLEHLNKIFHGNAGLISFLQVAFGYSLTGITDERCLFIAHGSGANGKTTTHEVLAQILGDYAVRTPTESILVKRNEGIPNDLAKLKGARFVYCSEIEEGKRLAESLIKDLTGNDTISARFMRGEWFTFQPAFKLWIATNHKPVIRGTDNAIWSRIRLISFTVSIPEEERIPRSRFMEKISPELSGILTWAVAGCQDWVKCGLMMPEEVRRATEGYRGEMDVLSEFINACCIISETASATAKELYNAYVRWAEQNGEKTISQTAFGIRLTERGFIQKRRARVRRWSGIGLISE